MCIEAIGPIEAVDGPRCVDPQPAPEPFVARDARAEALQVARHATVFIPAPFAPPSALDRRRRPG